MAAPRELRRIGASIAETLDVMAEASPRPGIDERLARVRAERAAQSTRTARVRRAGVGGMAVAAVLAAAAFLLYLVTRPAELAFQVAGAPGRVGEWVAAGDADVPLAFSDGTRLDVRRSARARVVTVGPRGAEVLLERGSLHVDVVHREGTRWVVAAGPFEVHVVGTRFEASWDAGAESLGVVMREGRVEVTGPCLRERRAVSTGETVQLSCREPVAQQEAAATSASVEQVSPPGATSAQTAAGGAPVDAPRAAGPPGPGWRDLFRRADYPAAFRAAEAQGIDDIVARGSSGELFELADLARFAKRSDLARRTYVALRDRFAGSDQAATAAFHLGRMSFGGADGEAERWLSIYLTERPGGSFAAEALGRILEIQSRAGRTEVARQTATRYLTSFPQGAHAPLARSIVSP